MVCDTVVIISNYTLMEVAMVHYNPFNHIICCKNNQVYLITPKILQTFLHLLVFIQMEINLMLAILIAIYFLIKIMALQVHRLDILLLLLPILPILTILPPQVCMEWLL